MDAWGSFPLADEAVDLDSIDFTDVSVTGLPQEDSTTLSKLSPGHHRSTRLLDGITCSSSAHSSPAGSFDGTTANQTPPAAAAQQPEAEEQPYYNISLPNLPASSTVAAATLLAEACPAPATNSSNPPAAAAAAPESKPAAMVASKSSSSIGRSSSQAPAAHHPAPVALQLPDFSTFMLPEECAFTESSMDDGLTTPTPHTPVVQNIFAGDGLPVSCHGSMLIWCSAAPGASADGLLVCLYPGCGTRSMGVVKL